MQSPQGASQSLHAHSPRTRRPRSTTCLAAWMILGSPKLCKRFGPSCLNPAHERRGAKANGPTTAVLMAKRRNSSSCPAGSCKDTAGAAKGAARPQASANPGRGGGGQQRQHPQLVEVGWGFWVGCQWAFIVANVTKHSIMFCKIHPSKRMLPPGCQHEKLVKHQCGTLHALRSLKLEPLGRKRHRMAQTERERERER